VQTFVKVLRPLVVQELEPQLLSAGRKLSETPPFPYSRPIVKAAKTVFNLVPCANKFEQAFAEFLEDAPDVDTFSKLPEQFGFAIEYTDAANNLRYYEPDFCAIASNGVHYLIETKGRKDVDVAAKDRAATLWCENATRLTGQAWQYVKVPQKEYEELHPDELGDVLVLAPTPIL
jgi:type III restriction enzyme